MAAQPRHSAPVPILVQKNRFGAWQTAMVAVAVESSRHFIWMEMDLIGSKSRFQRMDIRWADASIMEKLMIKYISKKLAANWKVLTGKRGRGMH